MLIFIIKKYRITQYKYTFDNSSHQNTKYNILKINKLYLIEKKFHIIINSK